MKWTYDNKSILPFFFLWILPKCIRFFFMVTNFFINVIQDDWPFIPTRTIYDWKKCMIPRFYWPHFLLPLAKEVHGFSLIARSHSGKKGQNIVLNIEKFDDLVWWIKVHFVKTLKTKNIFIRSMMKLWLMMVITSNNCKYKYWMILYTQRKLYRKINVSVRCCNCHHQTKC